MATPFMKLLVALGLDSSDYNKGLNQAEGQAKTSSKNISDSLQKIGGKLTKVGGTMSLAFTAPIMGGFTMAIKGASDLNESVSKTQVVFGNYADDVIRFSESAASGMGMSQQAALEASGTYGNLFRAMGITEETSAGMSTSLVALAGDLASFNNMDPTEVLDALRAGLSGETEPLKRLGVNINQALLEAKALEMGLWDGNGAIDAAAKAQASYALILEQTTLAQGDFARTSSGLANMTRIVKAQFADMAANLGAQLLPIAIKLMGVIQQLLGWFNNLSPGMKTAILVILGIVAAIGPLLVIVGQLVTAIGAIIPVVTAVAGVLTGPILAAIAAVIAVVALLALAWKNNWGGIREKVAAVTDWIVGKIQQFLAAIQAFWSAHGAQITATAKAIWDGVLKVLNWFVTQWKTIFQAFQLAFSGDWRGFGEKLREVWDNVWNAIKTVFSGFKDWLLAVIPKVIEAVVNFFKNTDWGQVGKNIVQGIANGITHAVDWIIKAVQGIGAAAIAAIKGFLGIASPSKVFAGIGGQMMEGLALGIHDAATLPAYEVNVASKIALAAAGGGRSVTYNNTYNYNFPKPTNSLLNYGGLNRGR